MKDSDSITIAKAISILLMVFCHAGCDMQSHDFIYMFHMPLFFIMSGYCLKEKYFDDMRTFIVRRIKGIWWPYVKWGLFFLLLHNIFYHLNIYNDVFGYRDRVSHLYTLEEFIKKGLNLLRFLDAEQLLGGYWFLKELFFASIIGFVCLKITRKLNLVKSGGGNLFASDVDILTCRQVFSGNKQQDIYGYIFLPCRL